MNAPQPAFRVEKRSIGRHSVDIELPFPVSVNAMFGQAPGQKRFPTADYKTWQVLAEASIRRQRPRRMSGPVHVTLTYEDRGRADIDNLNKGVLDMLVKQQIIEDDRRQIVRSINARWGHANGVRVQIISAEE